MHYAVVFAHVSLLFFHAIPTLYVCRLSPIFISFAFVAFWGVRSNVFPSLVWPTGPISRRVANARTFERYFSFPSPVVVMSE